MHHKEGCVSVKAVLSATFCVVLLFPVAAVAGEAPPARRPQALYVNVADDADKALADLAVLVRSKQWDKAAETAQRHIETGGGKLFDTGDGVYISFAEKVRRLVLAWPEAGRRAYRARYDAPAKKLCDAAHAARDVHGLAEVARRYLPSSTGPRALAALADLRAQRGQLRAAERALMLAMQLAPAGALEAKLKAVRAALARTDDVPAPAARLTEIGGRRWSLGIVDADVDATMAADLRARGLPVPKISHPAVSGGKVFVQTTRWVGAAGLTTGKLLWRYPERPGRPSGRECADAVLGPAVRSGCVVAFVSGELVAFAADTGRRLWSVADIAAEAPAKGRPEAKVLVNSAAVTDGRVFVCAAVVGQETASVVVAAEVRTGAVLWRRKLSSHLFRGMLGRGVHPAPAVCAEGAVFVSTNLGAVAAIDAATGEVRWLARYNAFSQARRRAASAGDGCWRNGRPVVYRGMLIVAPQDADHLIAFDMNTGRQQWRASRQGMRHLIGAANGSVYVSGDRAGAVDTATGKQLWLSDKIGRLSGRPALLASGLLVPVRKGIVRVDIRTGKLLSTRALEGTREPGNLVGSSGLLLSASFDRIDAYAGGAAVSPPRKPQPPENVVYEKTSKLTLAWRTPFDMARSLPTLVASDAESILIATEDRGKRRSLGWDTVERRRIRDGHLIWRADVGQWRAKGHLEKDVFVAQGNDGVTALDMRTGAVKWSGPRGWRKTAPRIIDTAAGGGAVFVARASGEIAALDAGSGKQLWRRKLDGSARRDGLYFNGGRFIVCLEATGTTLWLDPATGKTTREVRIDREDARLTDRPALQERTGRLCLVVGDREVRNIRLDTGKTLWKAEMPFAVGRVAASADGRSVVVFPDRWSFGGKITCFNAATGERLWRRKPVTADPASVAVGGGLIVSAERKWLADVMTAWRMGDGTVAWTRSLPGKPGLNEIADAGAFIVGIGSDLRPSGFRGRAVVVRKEDGRVVKSLWRPGAAHLSAADAGGTLLLLSGRGTEAHRMMSEEAIARRLAEVSKAVAPPVAERAWLHVGLGRHERAMELLDESLMAESIEPSVFSRLHDQLAAIRELSRKRRPTTYDAPFFRVPPQMDGRLREDWRADRAAMLHRPRFIERVQGGRRPGRFWAGPNDLSATMYLAWDNANLYVAVDVRDDVHTRHDFDADTWQGDCLIIAFDPEGNGGHRMHGMDEVHWLALTAKAAVRDGRARPGGEQHAKIKADESGVVYELAVPWKELGVAPRVGLRFGLNIMVTDDDGRGAAKAVSWTPGLTQHRNRAIIADEMTPALFGEVILKER